MYETIKGIMLSVFKAPGGTPNPPAGHSESIRIFRASEKYLNYQLYIFAAIAFLKALVLFVICCVILYNAPVIGLIFLAAAGLFWCAFVVIGYFTIRMEYDMRYYIVTDRSLRIRKGIWTIVEHTLTFANIQNVSIEQGPIQRMLGISTLVVETAGGGGAVSQQQGQIGPNYHCATLQGLEEAELFRDLILNYLKKLPHSSGLGTPGEKESLLHPAALGGFSSAEITALKEILSEIQALRNT